MKNKKGGACLVGILVLIMAGWMIKAAIERSETAECISWKSQSVEYPGFYLTKWQAEQCAARHIQIEAPVR